MNGCGTRSKAAVVCVVGVLGVLAMESSVYAGDRSFLVILASSPKQFPANGQPAGGFPSGTAIERQYFDLNPNNNIFSFAEYWEEISYGDVTITGQTAGWFDLPWSIQPPLVNPARHVAGSNPPVEDDIADTDLRITPANYLDLNGDGRYQYGMGERFNNGSASVIVDVTGDPGGQDDGPTSVGIGSREKTQRGNPRASKDVWMPGERFLDMDQDNRWDGLDETNNSMDFHTEQLSELAPGVLALEIIRNVPDGRPDLKGRWTDLNGDGSVQNTGACNCAPGETCFLADSDNDGRPDCCPNGPASRETCTCPPLRSATSGGESTIDCNGNLIDDTTDIANGTSRDILPWVPEGNRCVPGDGNGVPDECEFENPRTCPPTGPTALPCCRAPGQPGQENPCASLLECEPIVIAGGINVQCESPDAIVLGGDGDGALDMVEPFENFLRRWDPCLFDRDSSPENEEQDRTHWIKLYDPQSFFAGEPQTCSAPPDIVDYGDPEYIVSNYPGNPRRVISQAHARPLFGQHDPLGRLGGSGCPSNPPISGEYDFSDNRCICSVGIEFDVIGDVREEAEEDCCNPANYKASLLANDSYPLPDENGLVGDRRCYAELDVNGDGLISLATETNICARIVGKPGGKCRAFDINNDDRVACPILREDPNNPDDNLPDPGAETKLCLAGLHAQFDPSDRWTNVTGPGPAETTRASAKMQVLGGRTGTSVPFTKRTPEPGTTGFDAPWYEPAWEDRYGVDLCYDVAGQETTCDAPDWPVGASTSAMNVPIVLPFDDADLENFDAVTDRRYFRANWGGRNGRGQGWIGPENATIRFETGPLGPLGFEEALNRPILPEERDGLNAPPVFYDGYVEHDDLPSSKYHMAGDQWLGEMTSPYRSWYGLDGLVVEPVGFEDGIERFDPKYTRNEDDLLPIPAIYGEDQGSHQPNRPQINPDGVIVAGGPYAINVHGALGRDAGNVMTLELLTRRTDGTHLNNGRVWESIHTHGHPYAGPSGENLGFRDYNLDGLIDLGETRPVGSDNYIADVDPDTRPDNGTGTDYPWNRRRLLEDCIAVLDDGGIDFDDFVDANALSAVQCSGNLASGQLPVQFRTPGENTVTPKGVSSGIVLLPAGTHKGGDFIFSPRFYPIHNEDGMDNEDNDSTKFPRPESRAQINYNIFFHDLVIALDSAGEGALGTADSQKQYSAHEYLHAWEGLPDLYDYNIFDPPGRPINCPIGAWDIMTVNAGMVHPTGILKAAQCPAWIEPTNLAALLTPGVDKVLTLPPAEYVRDDSYFYFENENRPGERFYFWSAGQGFDEALPGPGVIVMHTDVRSNSDALPPQERIGSHFTFSIVQADGLDQLASCENTGDSGDAWPGSTGKTRFDCDTEPASRWYTGNACSGLTLSDITTDGQGSARVTVNWVPTNIPGLRFVDPPGGTSVGGVYQIRVEMTDVFGGSLVRFFYSKLPTVDALDDDGDSTDENPLDDPNGANFIGFVRKSTPGTQLMSLDWIVTGLADGTYYIVAEIVPGTGPDGRKEDSFTEPRGNRNNLGTGDLQITKVNGIDQVNVNEVVASGSKGSVEGSVFRATQDAGTGSVCFVAECSGGRFRTQVGDQVMIGGTLRTVTGILDEGTALQLSSTAPGAFRRPWFIVRPNRTARLETWTARCINTTGTQWEVFSSLTQPKPPDSPPVPNPYSNARTSDLTDADTTNDHLPYTSANGAVQFKITRGPGDSAFGLGDTFSFSTTGISAVSAGVSLAQGRISEGPTAIIDADKFSGDPPLTVAFDGRRSIDPNGEPLEYLWTFGDGGTSTSPQVTHTFVQARTYTVVLRVTNARTRLINETSVDIAVTNNSPKAQFTVSPTSGKAPLEVRFDASASSDTESTAANLIFQWDFGDGTTANDSRTPGTAFSRVSHLYSRNAAGQTCSSQLPCTFVPKLTVTDQGGRNDTKTATIVAGNSQPPTNITITPTEGSSPLTVVFNAINARDPDGDKVCINWHWDDTAAGDNSTDVCLPRTGSTGSANGDVTHQYVIPSGTPTKTFRPTATLYDYPGDTSTTCTCQQSALGSKVVFTGSVIVNQPTPGSSDPRAEFTIIPNPPVLNEPFAADGRRSVDRPPGGRIVSYHWDWGDGSQSTGETATHTYTLAGTYIIALTVADADVPAHTNTKRETVVVLGDEPPDPDTDNHPPTATFTVDPARGVVGEEITFDASGSSDEDGDDLTFAWSFGDGENGSGMVAKHTYAQTGTYSIRLTVEDENNGFTDVSKSLVVEAESSNRAPVALIASGQRNGAAPLSLTFDGRNSYDPDGDALSFSWTFRSNGVILGEPLTDPVVSRVFSAPGDYRVQLTVTDAFGLSTTSDEVDVTVFMAQADNDNEPPSGQDQPPEIDNEDSAVNRPEPIMCGLGMLTGLFGSILGLSLLQATRRRIRP